jgi:hypothetical protein
VVRRENETVERWSSRCGREEPGRAGHPAVAFGGQEHVVDPLDLVTRRVREIRQVGVHPSTRAAVSRRLVALVVAGGQEGVDVAVVQMADRGLLRLRVEIADEHPDRVVGAVRVEEVRGPATLAGVQRVRGVTRRRAALGVARSIVGAACQVRGDHVERADRRFDPHPQCGAQRAREMGARFTEHRQRREDHFAIERRIVSTDDLVPSADSLRLVAKQTRDHRVRLLDGDDLRTVALAELADEQLDPLRELAPVGVARARDPVEDVLGDDGDARARRGPLPPSLPLQPLSAAVPQQQHQPDRAPRTSHNPGTYFRTPRCLRGLLSR